MLNSVAKYLWGSGDQDPDQLDGGDQGLRQQDLAAGCGGDAQMAEAVEQPALHHSDDEDWVLVGLAEQGDWLTSSSADAAAPSNGQVESSTAATTTSDALPPAPVGSTARPLGRVSPSCSRGLARGTTSGLVHPATTQQLVRITRAAQTLQRCQQQKAISAQRCRQLNKVKDYQSHPKVKTNNRRNKHLRPSGCKSSRFTQRM